ncbi:hypothetical protein B0H14DRAFT_2594245 [Mycena olivaceomarginata]|nr:hypothetical protein B0H14DRAFT_2594245 [Mycena olivaceomarginata]
MVHKPTVTEICLDNITSCLTLAVTLLNELSAAFNPPFVQPLSSTIVALMNTVQIQAFVQGQLHGNKIKQLFRINGMNNLLKDCYAGLDEVKEVFGEINLISSDHGCICDIK